MKSTNFNNPNSTIPAMPSCSRKRRIKLFILTAVMVLVIVAVVKLKQRFWGTASIEWGEPIDTPSPSSTWPWSQAKMTTPHKGVTHWTATASDGTILELFKFDFAANPKLRFEIYDQDEDDKLPFDQKVSYWSRGVGAAVKHLSQGGCGPVLMACNGIFFGYDKIGPGGIAYHVSPVVLRGKPYYFNVAVNHRWTFGVKQQGDKPIFKTFFKPGKAKAAAEFDFAAASAQCLLQDGKPLKLQSFPKLGEKPLPQPVPSTKQEAGHIPIFDHMKTSRTSLGWTKDSRQLYLLFVKELDSETASAVAMLHNKLMSGGWTVRDIQRFWQSMGIPNAINSDAGNVGQLTYLRPDGKYELLPPRWASDTMRMVCPPDFRNAPQGGSLTYFYVREAR